MTTCVFNGIGLLLLIGGCSTGRPDIDWGKVECAHCRMNVVDRHFGAAIVTTKGRAYIFDAPECMVHFVGGGAGAKTEVSAYYVADFAHPGVLIDATKALYLHASNIRSPMGGDCAAFATSNDREIAVKDHPGEPLDWKGVEQLFGRN